jgi:flagellin
VNQAVNVAEAINKVQSQTGVMASVDDAGEIKLTSMNGKAIDIKEIGSYTGLSTDTGLTAGITDAATAVANPTPGAATADSFRINGVSIGAIADGVTAAGQGANVAAAINQQSGKTGVTAADGRDIVVEDGTGGDSDAITQTGIDGSAAGGAVFHGNVTLSSSNVNGIVVGGANEINAGMTAYEGIRGADTKSTNTVSSVDVSTASGALAAITTIDAALSSVNSSKAALGAYQNRFTAVVSNLQATSENLAASRSRIQDADFASETASLTRGQILQQAGTAMLAQANSLPNGVLALLRG